MDEKPDPGPAPVVSVVIPVHNNAEHLADQLDGIARGLSNAPRTEVVVVDNKSTDGSAIAAELWASEHPTIDLRVIEAAERAGEPYARNVGLHAANGDLILYCDGDDIVSDTWVPAMVDALESHPYATGPIDMRKLNEPWIANVRGTSVTGRSLLYNEVPYAHGCSMGFRKDALVELGGFDETMTAGCDLDIAIKAWRADLDLGYADDAVVHYRLRPSLATTFKQGRSYGRFRIPIRNQLRDVIDISDARHANLRRLGWLALHLPRAILSPEGRARWVWVASQLVGETQGEWESRTP